MAQVKIFGLYHSLKPIQSQLSDILHSCLVDSMNLPENKRFHRFFHMNKDDFYYPNDRSEKYTIIEISMFEGRSIDVKKKLILLIFERFTILGIEANDIEITIYETPKNNWGIRGLPGDELNLNYKVDI
ncbi:tautomerase family protein [Paenibacillus crassostreae]|uniref:4-oxalocrotonate tautomerase n=1 Tax=Paenibacillus crassostreae TaxID=1763538 RepID=A0A167FTP8_9BACL|nr:tautomerase family protein [Paenibacillus crassostreae]AOZ94074.1 tautomerase family protein [Paenibacillus crassostreae]OAB76890.1 4-oxalocrotonate tautomerase [Paenibacillus crassostreae]